MSEPTFSVIVPAYNAAATLPALLAALAAQSCSDFEIVLADNGSTDATPQLLAAWQERLPQLRIVTVRELGPAAARNGAIAAARGQLLAFTDADCIPASDWLARARPLLAEHAMLAGLTVGGGVGGSVARFLGLTTLRGGENGRIHRDLGSTGTHGYPTANLFIRRTALTGLDGSPFDVALRTGEDFDLQGRLFRAGHSLRFDPSLRVQHQHRDALAALLKQSVGFGRAHGLLLARFGQPGWQIVLPFAGCLHLRQLPGKLWLDLAGMDKKLLLLLAAALLLPALAPLWLAAALLLPLRAALFLRRRARGDGLVVPLWEPLLWSLLLLAKSAAFTLGRWQGARRDGVTL